MASGAASAFVQVLAMSEHIVLAVALSGPESSSFQTRSEKNHLLSVPPQLLPSLCQLPWGLLGKPSCSPSALLSVARVHTCYRGRTFVLGLELGLVCHTVFLLLFLLIFVAPQTTDTMRIRILRFISKVQACFAMASIQ